MTVSRREQSQKQEKQLVLRGDARGQTAADQTGVDLWRCAERDEAKKQRTGRIRPML